MTPLHDIDFYKADHKSQYPKGTKLVFSNWTARGSRRPEVKKVTFFGLQYYMKEYLEVQWNEKFFSQPVDEVISKYARRMKNAGINITTDHIARLHKVGYLPIEIWALPEGTAVPLGVPMFVMWNSLADFYWLVNYLETSLSHTLWGPCTSATTARQYRKIFEASASRTGGSKEFIDWQGHDFSCRGMMGHEASMLSGAGHLLSFTGTDTVSAIDFLEEYYGANSDKEIVGGSVPATEHSVMSMGGKESEIDTYRRLITEIYPGGTVSIVSDTWDYWKVLTETLPALREEILGRAGTLVIRPDSGDPVKIIVGDPDAPVGSPEYKGSFEVLNDTFGSTLTEKGYKQLNPHISLIYGDAITLERAEKICSGLEAKGFVASCVLGIGSFTYQFVTRDTFNFAMKATAGIIDGELHEIYKDPKTDSGEKKSARGLLAVFEGERGELYLKQQTTWSDVENCEFSLVFSDGKVQIEQNLAMIRKLVKDSLAD